MIVDVFNVKMMILEDAYYISKNNSDDKDNCVDNNTFEQVSLQFYF